MGEGLTPVGLPKGENQSAIVQSSCALAETRLDTASTKGVAKSRTWLQEKRTSFFTKLAEGAMKQFLNSNRSHGFSQKLYRSTALMQWMGLGAVVGATVGGPIGMFLGYVIGGVIGIKAINFCTEGWNTNRAMHFFLNAAGVEKDQVDEMVEKIWHKAIENEVDSMIRKSSKNDSAEKRKGEDDFIRLIVGQGVEECSNSSKIDEIFKNNPDVLNRVKSVMFKDKPNEQGAT